MKKRLLVVFLIIVCFTLVGCGTDKKLVENNDKNDSKTEKKSDVSNNSSNDEIELYSDSTKIVFKKDNSKMVYYYSGEKVTKYEVYLDYGNAATAKIMLEQLEDNDDTIKKKYIKGKYLVIEYAESEYEDLTVSDIRTAYSYLEELQENK